MNFLSSNIRFLNCSGTQAQLLGNVHTLNTVNRISKLNNFSVFANKNKPVSINCTFI